MEGRREELDTHVTRRAAGLSSCDVLLIPRTGSLPSPCQRVVLIPLTAVPPTGEGCSFTCDGHLVRLAAQSLPPSSTVRKGQVHARVPQRDLPPQKKNNYEVPARVSTHLLSTRSVPTTPQFPYRSLPPTATRRTVMLIRYSIEGGGTKDSVEERGRAVQQHLRGRPLFVSRGLPREDYRPLLRGR